MNAAGRAWRIAAEMWKARARFRGPAALGALAGERLAAYQHAAATDVARFAIAHSPFWREHAGGRPPEQWRSFKAVDKAAMMGRFDDYNTRGVTARAALDVALRAEETRDFTPTVEGLTVGLSSGTSGHRTISLLSDDETTRFIGFMLARMLDGAFSKVLSGRLRVAFFLRSNSNVFEASRSALVDFRYFDLTLTEAELVARLSSLRPNVLLGPPAMLAVVADLVANARLDLRPEIVFTGAEVLEPQVRAHLESRLGVRVRDVYHTSEGTLGITCREGRMHIPEDVAHVELEPLDDEPRARAHERRFTPVMTQLYRRVLPIIRYRMNDIVTLDERACPCGSRFRVLARVEGRCDDTFLLRRTDGSLKRTFPDAIRMAVLAVDGVREYRAEQLAPEHIKLYVDGGAEERALVQSLMARIGVEGCVRPRIDVVRGVPRDPDPRRKLIRVRRLWRVEDADARPSENVRVG